MQGSASFLKTPYVCHMLQSFNYVSGPLLDFLQYVHVFSSAGVHSTPDISHQCWGEGKDHLSGPAGNTSPDTVQDTLFGKITHCWLTFNLVSTRTLFFAMLLQTLVSPMWASEINDNLSVKYWVFHSDGAHTRNKMFEIVEAKQSWLLSVQD